MDNIFLKPFNHNPASEAFGRLKEGSPDVAFDSTLRKEMESLIERAKKKISSPKPQEKIADAG